jgi:hypothetical protein
MNAQAQESVHPERYSRNPVMNRRGRDGSHNAPQGHASPIKVSRDWAGGRLVARCIIMAIAQVRLL